MSRGDCITNRVLIRFSICAALVASCLALAPPVTQAQDGYLASNGVRFDGHLSLGWYGSFGLGFRADLPIVPSGLIENVQDDLALSLGAEFMWFYNPHYDGFGIFPIVALQWNFGLSPEWELFPELGVTMLFGPSRDRYWGTFVAPFLGVGVRYHFNPRNALLIRVNWPAGLQVGITF